MKITFRLFGGSGLLSTNTLALENFLEFQKLIKTEGKQTLQIVKVEEGK